MKLSSITSSWRVHYEWSVCVSAWESLNSYMETAAISKKGIGHSLSWMSAIVIRLTIIQYRNKLTLLPYTRLHYSPQCTKVWSVEQRNSSPTQTYVQTGYSHWYIVYTWQWLQYVYTKLFWQWQVEVWDILLLQFFGIKSITSLTQRKKLWSSLITWNSTDWLFTEAVNLWTGSRSFISGSQYFNADGEQSIIKFIIYQLLKVRHEQRMNSYKLSPIFYMEIFQEHKHC